MEEFLLRDPPTKATASLLSADGNTLITEKATILQEWAEHFKGILIRPSTTSDAVIARLLQAVTNTDLDLLPSLYETVKAAQQLSSGKASALNAMPAEIHRHGDLQLTDYLTVLYLEMRSQRQLPEDFKDAAIAHLHKRRDNRQLCDNHRGISLQNIARRIFACIFLNRLKKHMEQGFLPKMDLPQAFDTVNRCPEQFTQMVRQLHDGMTARVTGNGTVSDAFTVTNGAKQGCVLAPTLFNLMFSLMLIDVYRGERPGIRVAYRTDGHLLDHRRMRFQSGVSTTTVYKLLFADDCAINTTSEGDIQSSTDLFAVAVACDNFGLVINTEKTVVMYQPPPDAP
nr:unnamed protein product [Spirometra erinaceieuropaei]